MTANLAMFQQTAELEVLAEVAEEISGCGPRVKLDVASLRYYIQGELYKSFFRGEPGYRCAWVQLYQCGIQAVAFVQNRHVLATKMSKLSSSIIPNLFLDIN